MKLHDVAKQRFLFLQGPPGPFFDRLGAALRALGHAVHRINLNAGDVASWTGPAIDYRGTAERWPSFVDDYLVQHAITDVILFGDCRPLHNAARGMARLRGVRVHVFEEGYIRPDWATLELDGVNGHSSLPRDPKWYLDAARTLPPLAKLPTVPSRFRRRAQEATSYYARTSMGRWRFPHYKSHRDRSAPAEALGWLKQFALRSVHEEQAETALAKLEGKRYFALPLQLSSDHQIRVHSLFGTMQAGASYVIESFARSAPDDTYLLVKEHPLDSSLFSWRRFIRREARRLNVEDRVIFAKGGKIDDIVENSLGVVTVNSTTGTLALACGIPVIALGQAVYNIPGITFEGPLDAFWSNPTPPDPRIWDAFSRVLQARCLVYGGFASDEGIEMLVEGSIARLVEASKIIDLNRYLEGAAQAAE
ncbi:capsular biosynthesis protein [Sphingomonas histidinilytica]|jgi:capsular polysaccharide export protein|uniref:Capsular polysaccharide export protein n=1 Tax=Rhizorhabdus histidinilytica TaxID=439228 RepID=A0A1T5FG79_9SPHN|nr:capsular biosynthesis protein [Rhizorhabdus histidinilytica]MBO9375665.1 capsular biosynthesis protein [Rhizorhabdus histidinilytica]QEH81107.1 capsular biosynthesis protein [Sphingomonas sp. C8-2]SKB95163.1 capsular polysaccharide export protein [Rhizorhabdus histidinilytica]